VSSFDCSFTSFYSVFPSGESVFFPVVFAPSAPDPPVSESDELALTSVFTTIVTVSTVRDPLLTTTSEVVVIVPSLKAREPSVVESEASDKVGVCGGGGEDGWVVVCRV
jgi:hypothetical protein